MKLAPSTRTHKGFTLIELLVVIAIIGILSSVVLASLNTARNKGADAAVKGDLAGVRSSAEVIYDTYSNRYNVSGAAAVAGADCGAAAGQVANTIFADTNIIQALNHAKASAGGATALYCNLPATGAAYAVAAPLKTANTFWCIDSSGVSRGTNSAGAAYTAISGAAATAALADGTDVVCN